MKCFTTQQNSDILIVGEFNSAAFPHYLTTSPGFASDLGRHLNIYVGERKY